MAIDHYIPQVYLRKFYSPELGDRMFAMRKNNLALFRPSSKVVCGINDGSANAYLKRDDAIEQFLREIEPQFEHAVSKFRVGRPDGASLRVIAGLIAFIGTCSPAAMRIQSGPLQGMFEQTAVSLDDKGLLPPAPPELGGGKFSELLARRIVGLKVDPKFPQALGISSILKHVSGTANCTWEILHNQNTPFFTSDYPIAIEQTADRRINRKIFPLAPDLAIRITPRLVRWRDLPKKEFSNFEHRTLTISEAETKKLNLLIVQCAEDLVFYRDNLKWIPKFIEKNRHHKIVPVNEVVATSAGRVLWSTIRVQKLINSPQPSEPHQFF